MPAARASCWAAVGREGPPLVIAPPAEDLQVARGESLTPEAAAASHARLLLAEDDDHDDGVPRPFQELVGLEAEEPLDELEAAGELHHGLELLREDHPGEVSLPVEAARAVLDRFEGHALAEDLAHGVDVVERGERGAHDQAPAALGPGPAPRRVGPRGGHVTVEDVEAAALEGLRHGPQVGDELLGLQQVPLRVLHADRRVDRTRQPEVRHVADDQLALVPLGGEPLAQELDVPRRQVEPGHPIAAIGQSHQVGPGAAGDVDDAPDGPPGESLEAVDQEVDLALSIEIERDLVEPRGAVLLDPTLLAKLQRLAPHQARSASRITQEAAMPVRPVGSQACATSTRSPPITWQPSSIRTISTSSGTRSPPGSGEPVPGASAGSRTSTSIVT